MEVQCSGATELAYEVTRTAQVGLMGQEVATNAMLCIKKENNGTEAKVIEGSQS